MFVIYCDIIFLVR